MGHYDDASYGINSPGDVTLARSLEAGTLNMIIGGHSQEPVCMVAANKNNDAFKPGLECKPDQQNGTWIMQAHEWGKYVGKAEFKRDKEKLTLLNYQLLPVNLYVESIQADGSTQTVLANDYITPDPQLKAVLAKYQAKGAKQIEGKIGYVNARLEGDRSKVRFEQTNLARVIIQAQMNSVGADFGVLSAGGVRESINAGDVSYKDILTVQPFKNKVAYIDFTGRDVLHYLNVVTQFPPDSGAYLQFHKVSFQHKNNKLTNVSINDAPLDENKVYRMSINEFNASGGDKYPIITHLQGFVSTDETDAQALKRFFAEHSPVNAAEFMPK